MGDTTVTTGQQPTTAATQGDPAGATQPTTGTPGKPAEGKNGDEPLGENGVKALRDEREARKAEAEARKALEKRLDTLKPLEQLLQQLGGGDPAKGKSEIDQLAERHTKLEEEIRSERDARWRAELAHEHGLTPSQAKRLIGATREEMAADAEELVKDFAVDAKKPTTGSRPKPDRSQGGVPGGATSSGKAEGLAEAKRRFGDKTKTTT